MAGASSSVIKTVASSLVPAVTRAGRAPKPSFTRSASSWTLSRAAVKVNDFSVSPPWKVTLEGTPE